MTLVYLSVVTFIRCPRVFKLISNMPFRYEIHLKSSTEVLKCSKAFDKYNQLVNFDVLVMMEVSYLVKYGHDFEV